MKSDSYIESQIAQIPDCGDDALYRLASYLEMFENLVPGRLTAEQREAVHNFALGWQASEPDECVASEFDFPESQYIAHSIDADTAIELSESWRRGEYLPIMGHPADPISRKLNQMRSQPIALDK